MTQPTSSARFLSDVVVGRTLRWRRRSPGARRLRPAKRLGPGRCPASRLPLGYVVWHVHFQREILRWAWPQYTSPLKPGWFLHWVSEKEKKCQRVEAWEEFNMGGVVHCKKQKGRGAKTSEWPPVAEDAPDTQRRDRAGLQSRENDVLLTAYMSLEVAGPPQPAGKNSWPTPSFQPWSPEQRTQPGTAWLLTYRAVN